MLPPAATATTLSPALPDLSLIVQNIKDPPLRDRLVRLTGDDAQCIADFLGALLSEDNAFPPDDKKCLFTLLQRVARYAQVLPQSYRLQEIRCDFTEAREGGAFADIFQGEFQGRHVCVKAVRIFQREDNVRALRAFAKEIVLWAHLSHENILPFYGIYQQTSGRICIISPWMDAGDLSMYLKNSPLRPRLPMVLDVTAGLQYLHQSNIVHGDLKAKNILVSNYGRALIADFGISRTVVSTKLASTQLSYGTTRWMAPELIIGDTPLVTFESDVWSLGCVYYEILTRKFPYHDIDDRCLLRARDKTPELTPSRPTNVNEMDDISDIMWDLMKKCWELDPSSRPSCNDIYVLIPGPARTRNQQYSQDDALWKATRRGTEIGALYERARNIVLQFDHEDRTPKSSGNLIASSNVTPTTPAQPVDADLSTNPLNSEADIRYSIDSREVHCKSEIQSVNETAELPGLSASSRDLITSNRTLEFGQKKPQISWTDSLRTSQSASYDPLKGLGDVKVEQLKESDILIALVGPSGSGKSSFLSAIAGEDKGIGHGLSSQTSGAHAVRIHVPKNGMKLVLVDTPSFGDAPKSDREVLGIIFDWLRKTGSRNIHLRHVLYFHRISDNGMDGAPLKSLELFEKICEPHWFNKVMLVTTMWDELDEQDIGIIREQELKDTFWKPMIDRGSTTRRHDGTVGSAWDIIYHVLENSKSQQRPQLQKETVEQDKALSKTDVGYELYAQMDGLDKKRKDLVHTLHQQMTKPGLDQEVVGLLGAQSGELERSGKMEGASKWTAKQINPTKDIRADDTIIAFMGPTGAGKSFFIDLLTDAGDQDRRAGDSLKTVTSQIEASTVVHPFDVNKRVVLVDTPPFDDTTRSDMQILQMISDWLRNMYMADIKLSGLIYLHRITDNRIAGSPYKNLRMFGELCGDVAMNQVFLVSTMWGKIKSEIGEARETELKTKFWKPMIERGSTVERLSETTGDGAWRIVKQLIESHEKKPQRGVVLLQEEMVDLGIKLNETQAGKTLYTSLQKEFANQKDALKILLAQVERSNDFALSRELRMEYNKVEADFQKTFEEAKKLKGTRIAGIFGGKKAKVKAVKIGEV